jgi:hypothetical protein
MKVPNKIVLSVLSLLLTSAAVAADRATSAVGSVAEVSQPERYARRCQKKAPERDQKTQGPQLWGTLSAWDEVGPARDMRKSVLVSVNAAVLSQKDVGRVLQGTSSEGQGVEVAICEAEVEGGEEEMTWYRVEAWNPVAQAWENPCKASGSMTRPRALAVGGVWDGSGAHQEEKGKLTLACEGGVINKCIRWGYKPWATRDGKSLAPLHQACTRMARADYCGNGVSHTREGTTIDMYDVLGVQQPSTEASAGWDPARATFEAAWGAEGAVCMARTRDGRGLEEIEKECPGRFTKGKAVEVGQGERCTLKRVGESLQGALLKNRGY